MKLRVLLCGTGFGKFYLEALRKLESLYEVAGILGQGGAGSMKLAKDLAVPYYVSVDEVDAEAINAACVVVKSSIVGGNGTDIALKLLKRSISVLQEHPVSYEDYLHCMKAAKAGKCKYTMNSFYSYLPAEDKFIKSAKKISSVSRLICIEASTSIQLLFPLIDTLGKTFGSLISEVDKTDSCGEKEVPYCTVRAKINEIPLELKIYNQMDLFFPERNMFLTHRIILTTNMGTLTLTDAHGDVLWSPVIHGDLGKVKGKTVNKDFDELLNLKIQEKIYSNNNSTFYDLFNSIWPDSITAALRKYYEELITNKLYTYDTQYYLNIIRIWEKISRIIGEPDTVMIKEERPVSLLSSKEYGTGSEI